MNVQRWFRIALVEALKSITQLPIWEDPAPNADDCVTFNIADTSIDNSSTGHRASAVFQVDIFARGANSDDIASLIDDKFNLWRYTDGNYICNSKAMQLQRPIEVFEDQSRKQNNGGIYEFTVRRL